MSENPGGVEILDPRREPMLPRLRPLRQRAGGLHGAASECLEPDRVQGMEMLEAVDRSVRSDVLYTTCILVTSSKARSAPQRLGICGRNQGVLRSGFFMPPSS